jgi:hypothetical protein
LKVGGQKKWENWSTFVDVVEESVVAEREN